MSDHKLALAAAVKEAIRLGNLSDPVAYRHAVLIAGYAALAAHEAEQQAPPYTAPKLRALIDRVAEQQAGEAAYYIDPLDVAERKDIDPLLAQMEATPDESQLH